MTAADLQNLHRARGRQALAGRVLGPYSVVEEVSRGGMGAVFKATRGRASVALKVLLPPGKSGANAERFQREARILRSFEHPGIVRVTDFGQANGLLYYAMELLEGRDLQNLTSSAPRSRRLKYEAAVGIMARVAEALEYCHDKGVIHRDVKPSNIIIKARGQPVLIDFGLVKADPDRTREILASLENHEALSVTGQLIGTPAFMAPEQLNPGGAFGPVEPRTDVWGLGSTLFFAVSGRLPYEEQGHIQHFAALMARDPMRLRDVDPEAPEALDDFCCWCLQREAARRPSMSEAAAALAANLSDYRLRFPDSGRARRNRAKPRQDTCEAEGAPPPRREPPESMAKLYWLLIIAACISGGSIYWLSRPPTLPARKLPAVSFESLEAELAVTSAEKVRIKARTNRDVVRFYIGEENWLINDGEFDKEIPLEPGLNRIVVRVTTLDQTTATKTLEVIQDKIRPDFRFDNEDRGTIRLEDDRFLTGKIRDRSAVKLTINGEPAPVTADKSFQMPTTGLDFEEPITVRAVDAAGNSRERVFRVSTVKGRAELKKLREWRERIARRKREILRTVKTAQECYRLGFINANQVENEFEAIAYLSAAIDLNPQIYNAYFYRVLARLGSPVADRKRELADFEWMQKLVPEAPDNYYCRARIAERDKKYDEAIKYYQLTVNLYDRLLDNQHIDINACYALSHHHLSDLYARKGNLRRAILESTAGLELYKRPPPGKSIKYFGTLSRHYLHRGRLYFENKDWRLAKKDFDNALEEDERNHGARVLRMESLLNLRDISAARQDYDYLLKFSPLFTHVEQKYSGFFK